MRNLICILILIIFSSNTCEKQDECHKRITFVNNTNKNLYLDWDSMYPDTNAIAHHVSPLHDESANYVQAYGQNDKAFLSTSCWEAIIEGNRIMSDTIMLFVFDSDVLKTYPWIDVTRDYMILKRFDLSIEDLQAADWVVSYSTDEI